MTTEPGNTNKGLIRRVKQHIIAKEHRFFAIFQPGFEETVLRELENIGIKDIRDTIDGGIEFLSKLDGCYRVNICSRTITRLLLRLTRFRVDRFDSLRSKVEGFPWELYILDGTALVFKIVSKKSKLYHTGRIEEEFKAGIKARLLKYGIEASYPGKNISGEISQCIFIRIEKNKCLVSLDTSGDLLYKRGDRIYVTLAPLRETTAALILLEAGLNKYDVLLDPMCGSGTFSIEAMGIFSGKLPNLNRDFVFKKWPCFRERAYKFLIKTLGEQENPAEKSETCVAGKTSKIYASDIDHEPVVIFRKNMEKSVVLNDNKMLLPNCQLEINRIDFFTQTTHIPPGKKCLIVMNPPYGNRLKKIDIESLYRKIGNTIRNHYQNCGYAIITPGLEYEKIMSLPYDRKILFMNGGIRVAVIFKDKYE